MSILTNEFVMNIGNPPLSFKVPPGGSQIHNMGNPHPGAPLAVDNIYNPHYSFLVGMVPIKPFMNQFGAGYYPTGRSMVYTRTMNGLQSLNTNIS
jgi:hypothetical protein